jgi:hypothetical protein
MQQPRAVFMLDRGGLSGLSSLPHLSHAGFDDVCRNDQPLECAVFVDRGQGVRVGWLEALEHLEGWHTLGHVEGILEGAAEIDRLVGERVGEEILGLHHAGHGIQILTGQQGC